MATDHIYNLDWIVSIHARNEDARSPHATWVTAELLLCECAEGDVRIDAVRRLAAGEQRAVVVGRSVLTRIDYDRQTRRNGATVSEE